MARLLGCSARDVQNDRPGLAERFARTHGCVLVLKGARTVIAAPSGEMWVNPSGNPGMASGGMGDVLAGVTGALRAQGLAPLDAARLATFVHGAAADRLSAEFAPFGFLASEVARLVPAILSELLP
jgi:NAD(P)H-hydrate epimerase